jgi:hypothetical protein
MLVLMAQGEGRSALGWVDRTKIEKEIDFPLLQKKKITSF